MATTQAKGCDKKIKSAELKLNKILCKIDLVKLNNYNISCLDLPKKECLKVWFVKDPMKKFIIFGTIIIFLLGVWCHYFKSEADCLLPLPQESKTLFRLPEDCSMCIRVKDVTRLANITVEEFEEDYAYTTNPVIITDATANWRATKEFSFEFFANFYRTTKMGRKINDCFYFSYKSGINSLDEVFEMDEKRANLSGQPWYVGWSTCYEEETRALRQYYNRPYFLPKTAESDMVDWIFMGGPGQGAHMHVDSVRHMSWQAQVRGHKRWQLAPPPECLYACPWLAFTVQPGEIYIQSLLKKTGMPSGPLEEFGWMYLIPVLVVDTNRWYHETSVLPGDISITIGAEYD